MRTSKSCGKQMFQIRLNKISFFFNEKLVIQKNTLLLFKINDSSCATFKSSICCFTIMEICFFIIFLGDFNGLGEVTLDIWQFHPSPSKFHKEQSQEVEAWISLSSFTVQSYFYFSNKLFQLFAQNQQKKIITESYYF